MGVDEDELWVMVVVAATLDDVLPSFVAMQVCLIVCLIDV